MDIRGEVRQFLTSKRAKVTPEQAGLQWYGDKRRVPGLRREEVALIAGVSVDYYVRLERGNVMASPKAWWRRWPVRFSLTRRNERTCWTWLAPRRRRP